MTSTNSFRSPTTTSYQSTDVPHNTPNAALTGALSAASAAASKPLLKPKPAIADVGRARNALAAATRAGSAQSSPTRNPAAFITTPVSRQTTGSSSIQSNASASPSPWNTRRDSAARTLAVPTGATPSRTRSPSSIAATLAAARYTPNTQSLTGNVQGRRSSEDGRQAAVRARVPASTGAVKGKGQQVASPPVTKANGGESFRSPGLDVSSIPPTSALVKMFEQQPKPVSSSNTARPVTPPVPLQATINAPPILSPKPQRAISLTLPAAPNDEKSESTQLKRAQSMAKTPPKVAAKPKPLRRRPVIDELDTEPVLIERPGLHAERRASDDFSLPPGVSLKTRRTSSSLSGYESAAETLVGVEHPIITRTQLPPPRRTRNASVQHTGRSTSRVAVNEAGATLRSLYTASPTSPALLHVAALNDDPIARPTSVPTSAYGRQSLQKVTPHMTGDSMANAMVGAALATSKNPSRAVSPTRPRPPPPRQSERTHHFFRKTSRTPSPPKQVGKLRTTLRKAESDSSSDEGRPPQRKGIFHRKHPNKHHEGARKRWRDKVTEHERKRYEGLWAANKGLCLYSARASVSVTSNTEDLQEVPDLVVRDIWRRSRLPPHVLEEVWELVDRRKVRRLTKMEFVVGTWLIDQRLKGRKLPIKVGESVWASVRGSGTIITGRR